MSQDYECLRRNQAFFKHGILKFEPEYVTPAGKKPKIIGFTEVPSVIPVVIKHDSE